MRIACLLMSLLRLGAPTPVHADATAAAVAHQAPSHGAAADEHDGHDAHGARDSAVRAEVSGELTGQHLVYVELLGKGGAYGIGYERAITKRLAIGALGSFAILRGQQLTTVSPYIHATLLGREHALFGELGAVLVHSRIPSPVDDWEGLSDTGAGGVATLGYERGARHVVVRAYGAVMVGEGGAAAWAGVAVGYRP
jgi:hypothetical protein